MKIRTRVTVLFTLVVSSILLVVCSTIYFITDINRDQSFKTRLRNRALSTADLLLKVEGIDSGLLKKIDETTRISIQEKSVVVYNSQNEESYIYTDQGIEPVRAIKSILDKVGTQGELYYSEGEKDVLVIHFSHQQKIYKVVAAGVDRNGFLLISQLRFILIICFISGILITFISGNVFSKSIISPIKHIMLDLNEITSKDLSRKIAINETSDELGQLAEALNKLLFRLRESFTIQRRFIANASHELSTPLTSISSQLEITLQKDRNNEEYKTILSSVYEDVKILNQLTQSLLAIAKASGTTEGIELTYLRIDELILKLPAQLKKGNRDYRININFDPFPENEQTMLVFGNSALLFSAIQNIVLNACKYATNHMANISLHFSNKMVTVVIQNEGALIPEEEKELVFHPFYRGRSSVNTKGVGLGLSLSLQIIKLHKGSIDFESNISDGTLFTIQLPVEAPLHQV